MKVLLDMNLSPRWVQFFQSEDIESLHWSRIGPATAPDVERTAYARNNGLVILTHDLDFGAILAAAGGAKPSVVQMRSGELRVEVVGRRVVAALRQSEQDLDQGALITINPERTRVRILPLRGSDKTNFGV